MSKQAAVTLILSDARGIYIPRDFVASVDCSAWGISPQDAKTLENPENAGYWDSWADVLDNAKYVSGDGDVYRLWQDGDLFIYCFENMTAEEKKNFGFEEN